MPDLSVVPEEVDITPLVHPHVWRELLERWDIKGVVVNDDGSFSCTDASAAVGSLIRAVHLADVVKTLIVPSNTTALRGRVCNDIARLAGEELSGDERDELVEDTISDICSIAGNLDGPSC